MPYFGETFQYKAESLQFDYIMVVSFNIHCVGLKRQNKKKITVQILLDLTVPGCSLLPEYYFLLT